MKRVARVQTGGGSVCVCVCVCVQRFMEGLANDMRDIGSGQVPEVQGLRTTFQIERIVSGTCTHTHAQARLARD